MCKAGTPQDKLRMFIIYYLCNTNVSPGELDQYLIQLKDANCDIETIKYIKRYKAISKMNFSAASNQASSGASSAAIDFTAASAKLIRIRIFYMRNYILIILISFVGFPICCQRAPSF